MHTVGLIQPMKSSEVLRRVTARPVTEADMTAMANAAQTLWDVLRTFTVEELKALALDCSNEGYRQLVAALVTVREQMK